MNEKSNPMPMMYKTIPAVAELNKVPGFDPLKFLRHKVSRKTNEEMLQLELPYQKLWFRLRHPQGRMKLTTLRITEQLAIMEARVDDIIIRPSLKSNDLIAGLNTSSQKKNGTGNVFPYLLAYSQTIHSRHIDVQ